MIYKATLLVLTCLFLVPTLQGQSAKEKAIAALDQNDPLSDKALSSLVHTLKSTFGGLESYTEPYKLLNLSLDMSDDDLCDCLLYTSPSPRD